MPRFFFALSLILVIVPRPAAAQMDLPDFDLTAPDLAQLFQERPPMGACPVGDTRDSERLADSAHLLHLGVTNFYLDLRVRLKLTAQQRERLAALRDAARARWREHQRSIAAHERSLWELTGNRPGDREAVGAAIRAVEAERAEQRLDYVLAVMGAAAELTDAQRARVVTR